MDSTTLNRIMARAKYELEKANLATITNFEQAFNSIVWLQVNDDLPGQRSAWIVIFAAPDQLTLTFGNLKTGQNFACYAASSKKLTGRIHIDLSKAILSARLQREKIFNNATCVTRSKNNWNIYQIGEENV